MYMDYAVAVAVVARPQLSLTVATCLVRRRHYLLALYTERRCNEKAGTSAVERCQTIRRDILMKIEDAL